MLTTVHLKQAGGRYSNKTIAFSLTLQLEITMR